MCGGVSVWCGGVCVVCGRGVWWGECVWGECAGSGSVLVVPRLKGSWRPSSAKHSRVPAVLSVLPFGLTSPPPRSPEVSAVSPALGASVDGTPDCQQSHSRAAE